MNINQKVLILLLKSAITNEKYQLPKCDIDFDEIFNIAKAHGITAMLYYGAYNCGIDPECSFMNKLFLMTCKRIIINEQQVSKINDIVRDFEENGVDFMLLKGVNLKPLYPKPEMREMGDADILIKTEQYDIISKIMTDNGFSQIKESNHEYVWFFQDICIELHKMLIPSYNKDYYEYYGEGWRLAKKTNSSRYVMSKEDEFIYIFTHFAKHYRDAGIGIRHLMDLWIFIRGNNDMNSHYIEEELKKLQLFEFYKNISDLIGAWFLEKEGTEKTEFITQVIFGSGIYGTRQNSIISSALKGVKSEFNVRRLKIKKVCSSIFVSYNKMCRIYPILVKFPILLPIMWIQNIFRRLAIKGKFKKYSEDIRRITEAEVTEYQKSLNYVGLDFNFKD